MAPAPQQLVIIRDRVVTRKISLVPSALEILGRTWDNAAAQSLHEIRRLASRWKVVTALPIHLSHPLDEVDNDGERAYQASNDNEALFSANPIDGLFLDQIDMAEFLDIVQDGTHIYSWSLHREEGSTLWLCNPWNY